MKNVASLHIVTQRRRYGTVPYRTHVTPIKQLYRRTDLPMPRYKESASRTHAYKRMFRSRFCPEKT